MVTLCRTAKFPARIVNGFVLNDQFITQKNHHWVEVYHKKKWRAFDPLFGYAWGVPDTYYPICKNRLTLVSAPAGVRIQANFKMTPHLLKQNMTDQAGSLTTLFNLNRLPISMRHTLAIILLLPVGALITALFRNLIGLSAFGTFTPVLFALSFVMSDWRTGLMIFIVVFLSGLLGRFFLDQLKLLMVPRLGCILTGVIGLMTSIISVLDYYHLTPSSHAVLLPTVIIVMMVERYYITESEDGSSYALKLFINTFIIAITCFFILNSVALSTMIILFPEGLIYVLGVLILIGRYSGYRLTELFRFKDMVFQGGLK